MTTLDWIAVIALASAILFLLFTILLVVLRVRLGGQLTKLKRIRTKNKKKRKRLMRQRRAVEKKRRKYLIWALLLFVLAGAGAGASAYTIYYQSTNLNQKDQELMVKGYYYLGDIEDQLALAESGEGGEELGSDLTTLASRLGTFAVVRADYRLGSDYQQLLNRYYSSLKDLGINLASRNSGFYTNAEELADFKEDLAKVRSNQKEVFKTFSVNEASLKEQK
ncbi:hypothetical protein I6N96_14960 [Enterococcus sp. BWM-S5]|uniref:Uncharacterized protein n=1 Tax=Enterococcus larvae TaxID=2794352 RepID=A0ABS4CMC0_9ENTE|nr:hypothetical protein [Enterococcus larvae]MBP1047585.1 hypothetical protein [Enterococcus larvae]